MLFAFYSTLKAAKSKDRKESFGGNFKFSISQCNIARDSEVWLIKPIKLSHRFLKVCAKFAVIFAKILQNSFFTVVIDNIIKIKLTAFRVQQTCFTFTLSILTHHPVPQLVSGIKITFNVLIKNWKIFNLIILTLIELGEKCTLNCIWLRFFLSKLCICEFNIWIEVLKWYFLDFT